MMDPLKQHEAHNLIIIVNKQEFFIHQFLAYRIDYIHMNANISIDRVLVEYYIFLCAVL